MNRTLRRIALPIGAAALLGSSGFAFMATNVQQASSAGTSSNSVNGYNVNDIHYVACGTFTAMNGNFCNVEFKLVPHNGGAPANTGTNVQASVNNNGDWETCIYMGAPGSNQGTLWRCAIPQPTSDVTSLQIAAAQ